MKAAAKKIIRWMAPRIPLDARRAFLNGLADCDDYEALRDLASAFGVRDFGTDGDYGYIQGSAGDLGVFPLYAKRKVYAPSSNAMFARLLRSGGTYLDIGGNIGLTTIPIAQNPAVQCHVFEPDPSNARLLAANLAVNCPHGNVTMHKLALFDRADSLTFEMSPMNSGDNRVRLSSDPGAMGEETWRTVEVPARPLDDIVSDIQSPLAAKIDTQGAEPFVIAGGQRVLSWAGLLALEFWPYGMVRMGGDHAIVLRFLQENFRFGTTGEGDSDQHGSWQPMELVVGQLEAYAASNADTPGAYLDLLARRN